MYTRLIVPDMTLDGAAEYLRDRIVSKERILNAFQNLPADLFDFQMPYDFMDVASDLFNYKAVLIKHKILVLLKRHAGFIATMTPYPQDLQDIYDDYREIRLSKLNLTQSYEILVIAYMLEDVFPGISNKFKNLGGIAVISCFEKADGQLVITTDPMETLPCTCGCPSFVNGLRNELWTPMNVVTMNWDDNKVQLLLCNQLWDQSHHFQYYESQCESLRKDPCFVTSLYRLFAKNVDKRRKEKGLVFLNYTTYVYWEWSCLLTFHEIYYADDDRRCTRSSK